MWMFYYLGKHQDIQSRLRDEIKLAYEKAMDGPTDKDDKAVFIANRPYMKQCINEVMRKSILAPMTARYSNEDIVINGFKIPSGVPILQALGVTFTQPSIWGENVKKFDPDRFTIENSKKKRVFVCTIWICREALLSRV